MTAPGTEIAAQAQEVVDAQVTRLTSLHVPTDFLSYSIYTYNIDKVA